MTACHFRSTRDCSWQLYCEIFRYIYLILGISSARRVNLLKSPTLIASFRSSQTTRRIAVMSDQPTKTAGLPSSSDLAKTMSNRLASPPESQTPPSRPTKKTLLFPNTSGNASHVPSMSDAVDPNVLANALKDYDEAGRRRERTPGASPSRKRQRVYGDR